jgi:hypothetical protein
MTIFLELAVISTSVLVKGYVAAGGELQGKIWVGLKPPLPMLAIRYSHKVIAQGCM